MCNASVIHCKKGTFIHILCKELKRLGLQSYVALKRPLISEANQKKGFNLIGNVNIGLYTSRKKSHSLMSPVLPCSRVIGTSG